MANDIKKLNELIDSRNLLASQERQLYIAAVEKINAGMKELLKNDFGTTLVKNMGNDLAGEVARRYFDLGDYYITADQLYDRFVHFSYDNDTDMLLSDGGIRKAYYNYSDSANSAGLREITKACEDAQQQLFTGNRAQDELDRKGKIAYRKAQTKAGKIRDELTGEEDSTNIRNKNGKDEEVSQLQADHIQAREAIKYNTRYIREDKMDKLKKFYNSSANMQMINASANASKGDVRVCLKENGEVIYLNSKELENRNKKGESIADISYRATPEQLAEATISQWEKETKSGNKIKTLKEKGYLDENGKVKPNVKKALIANIRRSQDKESIEILKDTNYKQVSQDAGKQTRTAMKKILAGQIIYYVMPPMIFETQTIIRRNNITLDNFFNELKKAGRRIQKYVLNKMKEIMQNIAGNVLNKFIKSFFDIIIQLVKATIKRLVKIIKDVVLSLVNCGKILMDKNATANQKADAITKILSTTITAVVMELLFEYLEKQFAIPGFLMEPLQIIVSLLSTNIIMLVLNKVDLFDTQYGLLVANIDALIEKENKLYMSSAEELIEHGIQTFDENFNLIKLQIRDLTVSIQSLNLYTQEVLPYLDKISEMFDMKIDFNKEWENFLTFT